MTERARADIPLKEGGLIIVLPSEALPTSSAGFGLAEKYGPGQLLQIFTEEEAVDVYLDHDAAVALDRALWGPYAAIDEAIEIGDELEKLGRAMDEYVIAWRNRMIASGSDARYEMYDEPVWKLMSERRDLLRQRILTLPTTTPEGDPR